MPIYNSLEPMWTQGESNPYYRIASAMCSRYHYEPIIWSGARESNPYHWLGRPRHYQYTSAAFVILFLPSNQYKDTVYQFEYR